MNKSLKFFLAAGGILVSLAGALSHFVYEWTGQNQLAGLFVPVNESIWEHMKLFFFPMLFTALLLTVLIRRSYPRIFTGMLGGLLAGTLSIPTLFYTYSGILGFSLPAVDIGIFYVSVCAGFLTAYRLTLRPSADSFRPLFSCLALLLLAAFVLFSYSAPPLGIFAEPQAEAAWLNLPYWGGI